MSAKLLALERDTESSSSGSLVSGRQLSAEQSSATEGSSGLSSSASSSVMSLITKDVVDWKEGPKQCTGEEALELPGDNRSGVSWAEAGKENQRWMDGWMDSQQSTWDSFFPQHKRIINLNTAQSQHPTKGAAGKQP